MLCCVSWRPDVLVCCSGDLKARQLSERQEASKLLLYIAVCYMDTNL